MKNKPSLWKRIRRTPQVEPEAEIPSAVSTNVQAEVKPLDIPANDPLLAYIQGSPGVIDLDQLNLDSPTLEDNADSRNSSGTAAGQPG